MTAQPNHGAFEDVMSLDSLTAHSKKLLEKYCMMDVKLAAKPLPPSCYEYDPGAPIDDKAAFETVHYDKYLDEWKAKEYLAKHGHAYYRREVLPSKAPSNKLREDFKAKLLARLRDPNTKQAYGTIAQMEGGKIVAHCFFGLVLDILGVLKEHMRLNNGVSWTTLVPLDIYHVFFKMPLSPELRSSLYYDGSGQKLCDAFVRANDDQLLDFPQMAEVIDRYL